MRLDLYLVEQNYTKTRSQATDLIKRGFVEVDGAIITKAGYEVETPFIKIKDKDAFVGRGGDKLKGAILDFKLSFDGKIMIDIGSSTGGFTDCALQHGAKKVYAYDVGRDQMDETLKLDQRIELHEETNVLDVQLPEADIITIDVSFTSILPIMKHLQGFEHEIIALIKPQFEVGHVSFKKGVLKDIKKHEKILYAVLTDIQMLGFHLSGLKKSQVKGKMGNQEYLLYIDKNDVHTSIDHLVRGVLC
jgi:23S rRNA (cytidine1920-2'-O)/16S rRNA (cytidine1409-2'-O)-methyltransferase